MRRTTISSVIAAAARHLTSKASITAGATQLHAANPHLATLSKNAPSAPAMILMSSASESASTVMLPLQFVPSPLADNRFASRDDIDIAFRDHRVQSAAAELSGKIDRLRALVGYRSCLAMGVRAVLADQAEDGPISADAVAQRLREFVEQVEEQIVCARENIADHDAAARARNMHRKPLRSAVSKRLDQLVAERDRLIHDDESATRAASIGLPTRFSVLRNAGMSEAQIAATEPTAISPEVLTRSRQERIAEIGPHIEKLRAFGASPTFDAALLDGLGFDDLISARDGMKAPA